MFPALLFLRTHGMNLFETLKNQFPVLCDPASAYIYLDSAATALKPQTVVRALAGFYTQNGASVHRGIYNSSIQATKQFENARKKLSVFINAPTADQVIFTSGTTASINMLAQSFAQNQLCAGDEIILTLLEHHSNIVPWQIAAKKTGAVIKFARINKNGTLDEQHLESLFGPKTRLFACTHVSNALGTVNPVKKLTALAHSKNVPVLIDGAQACTSGKIDVQDIDCDFYAFSGHKMFGPTGIGVLFAKPHWLKTLQPAFGGGQMVETVTTQGFVPLPAPIGFEAGTPPIAQAIGLGAAVDFINEIGIDNITAHTNTITALAIAELEKLPDITVLGPKTGTGPVVSFVQEGIHPHDTAAILDSEKIAVRAGNHCCNPLMQALGTSATVRVSFSVYNCLDQIQNLCQALGKARDMFKG